MFNSQSDEECFIKTQCYDSILSFINQYDIFNSFYSGAKFQISKNVQNPVNKEGVVLISSQYNKGFYNSLNIINNRSKFSINKQEENIQFSSDFNVYGVSLKNELLINNSKEFSYQNEIIFKKFGSVVNLKHYNQNNIYNVDSVSVVKNAKNCLFGLNFIYYMDKIIPTFLLKISGERCLFFTELASDAFKNFIVIYGSNFELFLQQTMNYDKDRFHDISIGLKSFDEQGSMLAGLNIGGDIYMKYSKNILNNLNIEIVCFKEYKKEPLSGFTLTFNL